MNDKIIIVEKAAYFIGDEGRRFLSNHWSLVGWSDDVEVVNEVLNMNKQPNPNFRYRSRSISKINLEKIR